MRIPGLAVPLLVSCTIGCSEQPSPPLRPFEGLSDEEVRAVLRDNLEHGEIHIAGQSAIGTPRIPQNAFLNVSGALSFKDPMRVPRALTIALVGRRNGKDINADARPAEIEELAAGKMHFEGQLKTPPFKGNFFLIARQAGQTLAEMEIHVE
jgi:hypothetical protein